MTKDEQTRAIERAGKKIQKEIIRSPPDKDGTYQEIAKIKEEQKNEEKIVETEGESPEKNSERKITQEKKTEEKKPVAQRKEAKKPKKTFASVRANNLHLSTKKSASVCRFIKNKKIENAISDLEQVLMHKKAIPMRGEIPHRKGKGISSGRYLDNTAKEFLLLLKSLLANANANELNEPIISKAVANIGVRPYGKFGAVRRKRTHIEIKAIENPANLKKLNKDKKVKVTQWKKEKQ